MNEEFEKILSLLLERIEKNPDKEVAELAAEMGLKGDSARMLKETFDAIDRIDDNLKSLAQAKEEGRSRQSWMMTRIETGMRDWSNEEKSAAIEAIDKQLDRVVEEKLTKEDE